MNIKSKKLQQRSPPKYWKFAVLFGAHVGLLLSIGPMKVLGVYLLRFKEEFDATSGLIGAITTLTYFVMAVSGLGASMLSKRYSCRKVAMIGGFVIALGLILTSFARNIFQLLFCIDFLTGIGVGLAGNPCVVVIAYYFNENYATANGLAMAGVDLGIVFLPPLSDYLSEVFTWRGSLLILGAMSMNVAAMGALFRPKPRIEKGIPDEDVSVDECNESTKDKALDDHETNTDLEIVETDEVIEPTKNDPLLNDQIMTDESQTITDHSAQENSAQENSVQENSVQEVITAAAFNNDPSVNSDDTVSQGHKVSIIQKVVNSMDLHIFLIPKYLVLMPVTMIVALANTGILAHIVARGIYEGIPTFSASFLLSGIGATSVIARCTHGLIIDHGLMSAARLYTLTLVLASVFSFLSLLCKSFMSFLIYSLLYGSVCGVFQCASVPIVKSTVPTRMLGGAVAWLFIFRGLGAFLGGLTAGALFDATGNYNCSFIMIGGAFLFAAILMVAFSYAKGRKKRRDSIMLSLVELHVRQCDVGI